jgi:Fe-Mn family superoxide dismutase
MITRRQALQRTAVFAAASAVTTLVRPLRALAADPPPTGPFKLPPLPYSPDALEPHIDAQTMTIHHDRHHQAYINNLNTALANNEKWSSRTIEQILKNLDEVPDSVRVAVRNNAGGHYNHSLFWQMMKKGGGGEPSGALAKKMESSFTSFDAFKKEFATTATKVFGSGWAWLVKDGGSLKVVSTANQDSPLSKGQIPLLGIDVWEHAYYLKYQNKRPEYIAAFFNVINWDFVAEQFDKGKA